MDLALNNLQRLICHKTHKPTNQPPPKKPFLILTQVYFCHKNKLFIVVLFKKFIFFSAT